MRRSIHGMGRVMALAASVAVLPAGLAAQAPEASDANDRAAHAFMSAVDLGEVQQSMLATQRAANAEVRAYAQQMIGDHTNALHTREMLMQTERSGLLPRMGNMGGGNNGRAATAQAIGGPDVQGAGVSAPDIQGRGGAAQSSGQGNNHAQGTGSTQGTGGPVSAATGGPGIAGQGVATQDIEARGTAAQGNHGHQDAAAAGHGGMTHGGSGMPVTPEMVQQLMTVLQEHPMSRPVMTSNAQNLQVLSGIAAGPQFDRSYMDAQIGAHQYALTNLDRMLQQEGMGSDITSTMRMMRTAVASHLQTAQQIRARLGS